MNLTKDPIPKLIRQIAIPATVGFFFNTMYNIVDTWYASVSDSIMGQAALTFSFPIFIIIIAISSGLGTAASVLIANAMGAQDTKKANVYYRQSMSLLVILSIVGTLAGLALLPWLLSIQNAAGEVAQMASQYLTIIILGLFAFLGTFLCNNILSAQGDTKSFRNILIIGFFLNFFFNSLFMFGGLGVPGVPLFGREWFLDLGLPSFGVRGIALSTVLIQVISMIYLLGKVQKTMACCRIRAACLKPNWGVYKEFLVQGVPAAFNMMTVALGILIIQGFVGMFGDDAVAGYGVAVRIEQIALMPTIGLNIAVMTLMGQNNGAKLYARVKETYFTSIKFGILVVIPLIILIFLFADELIRFFPNSTHESIQVGADYLRISVWIFWGYVLLFMTTSGLQGIKRPVLAMVVGIVRQIALPLPIWYLLIVTLGMGLMSIWWSLFAIIWVAALCITIYMMTLLKKLNTKNEKL